MKDNEIQSINASKSEFLELWNISDRDKLINLFNSFGIDFTSDQHSVDCHKDTEYGRVGLLACFEFDENGQFVGMDVTE